MTLGMIAVLLLVVLAVMAGVTVWFSRKKTKAGMTDETENAVRQMDKFHRTREMDRDGR